MVGKSSRSANSHIAHSVFLASWSIYIACVQFNVWRIDPASPPSAVLWSIGLQLFVIFLDLRRSRRMVNLSRRRFADSIDKGYLTPKRA